MTQNDRRYHLALREIHQAAGATFAVRTGWSLPEQYGDAAREHAALRGHAAMFDRSYHSRFIVSGTDAGELLAAVFAGHVDELEEGRAMRAAALSEAGAITDLALIARTGGIAYLVTGEPGQRFDTFERLQAAKGADWDVQVEDRTESTCLLGVAGPAAAALCEQHLGEGLPARLQRLHTVTFEFHGFRTLVTRTSDLGEDGFEFMLAPAVAQHVIETLAAAGVPLAGAAALESARVEACIPAFDPDLLPGYTPAQADLDQLLGIDGGAEGIVLSAVLLEGDAVPAAGTPITAGGGRVGELRSCVRSFGLESVIGLASVATAVALPGAELDVAGIRATITAKPFLRRRS